MGATDQKTRADQAVTRDAGSSCAACAWPHLSSTRRGSFVKALLRGLLEKVLQLVQSPVDLADLGGGPSKILSDAMELGRNPEDSERACAEAGCGFSHLGARRTRQSALLSPIRTRDFRRRGRELLGGGSFRRRCLCSEGG